MAVVVSETLTSERVTTGVGVCGRGAGTKSDSPVRPVRLRPTLHVGAVYMVFLECLSKMALLNLLK